MRDMSRPVKKVDWKLVDLLLEANCHGTEIAPYFDLHPNTFYDKVLEKYKIGFTEYSQLKKAHGDAKLKKAQFEKALEKDNTMMIWLGKQRLGQKEPETKPPEFKHETDMDKVLAKWDSLKDELDGFKQKADGQSPQLKRED